MANKTTPTRCAPEFAACSVDLSGSNTPSELRLIPAGRFHPVDGRPEAALGWYLDDAHAAAIVAAAAARQTDYVIDYEHQTLAAAKNGQPAPAAGWFKKLEWRPGDGLYATDVRWTVAAAQMITAHEYRYGSPVFAFDPKTGAVLALAHFGLTNNPALDGLTDLAALAALSVSYAQLTQEGNMDDLLEQLRWLLNLPVGATAEEIIAQLQKLIDQIKAEQGETAAASFDLVAYFTSKNAEVAALKAQSGTPDPAKFVAIAALTSMQGELTTATAELAALKAEHHKAEVGRVVADALAAGKIVPAMSQWATDFGTKDLAALNSYLSNVTATLVPGTTQTGGKAPEKVAGSTDPSVIAHAALKYQTEQSNAGISVSTVEAVAHVTKGV